MLNRVFIPLLLCFLLVSCSDDTQPAGPVTTKKQVSRVKGKVTVQFFDSVIAGATVRIQPGNKTASTNASGEFLMDSIELGNYTLIVEKEGFKRQDIGLAILDSTERKVDLRMPRLAPSGTGMFYIMIIDGKKNEPLGGVNIYSGPTLLGVTDTTGKVTLQNTLNQYNEIQFVRPGFSSVTRSYWFGEDIVKYDTVRLLQYAEMLAWYPFAQSGIDSSGSGLHAQIEGGTFVNDRHGLKNRALQLNGSSDFVRVANAISLNFGTNKDFTICMWVKCSTSATSQPVLLSKTIGSGNDLLGYELSLQRTAGGSDYSQLQYTLGTDLGVKSSTLSGADVSDNEWHFCAIRVSRKDGVVLQKDKEYSTSTSQILGGNMDNGADLFIGRSSQSRYFRGTIDEVMIFAGELTDADLLALRTR